MIAAVFLWLASLWLKKSPDFRHHWKHYLIIGFLNSAFSFLLFAYAAQSLSASLLSILNATSPFTVSGGLLVLAGIALTTGLVKLPRKLQRLPT